VAPAVEAAEVPLVEAEAAEAGREASEEAPSEEAEAVAEAFLEVAIEAAAEAFLEAAAAEPLAEDYQEAEASIPSQEEACLAETQGEASMAKATTHPLGEEILVVEAPLVVALAGSPAAVAAVF
jgi:hypothetical protein